MTSINLESFIDLGNSTHPFVNIREPHKKGVFVTKNTQINARPSKKLVLPHIIEETGKPYIYSTVDKDLVSPSQGLPYVESHSGSTTTDKSSFTLAQTGEPFFTSDNKGEYMKATCSNTEYITTLSDRTAYCYSY